MDVLLWTGTIVTVGGALLNGTVRVGGGAKLAPHLPVGFCVTCKLKIPLLTGAIPAYNGQALGACYVCCCNLWQPPFPSGCVPVEGGRYVAAVPLFHWIASWGTGLG